MPQLRWLLDVGLPRPAGDGLDVVLAEELQRVPGAAGICEARELDRVLVTCNRDFCGPWAIPIDHPGIVVLATKPVDGKEIERELGHIEFRLRQYGGLLTTQGRRFFLKPDGYLARIADTGREEPLDPWKDLVLQDSSIQRGETPRTTKELIASATLPG